MLGKAFCVLCLLSTLFALCTGDISALTSGILDGAAAGVTYAIQIAGMVCLWCGILEVLTDCGILERVSRLLSPLLRRLFPHAWSSGVAKTEITASLAANFLGLGNAATPYALQAMEKMDRNNPTPETATDDMVMLCVLGAGSLSLLPTTILTLLRAAGDAFPYRILPRVWLVSTICAIGGALLCRLLAGACQGAACRGKKASGKHHG